MLSYRQDSGTKGLVFYWNKQKIEGAKIKVYLDRVFNAHKVELAKLEQKVEQLEEDYSLQQAALTLSENALNNANKRIGGLIDKRV